jgi:hypothetical protein
VEIGFEEIEDYIQQEYIAWQKTEHQVRGERILLRKLETQFHWNVKNIENRD